LSSKNGSGARLDGGETGREKKESVGGPGWGVGSEDDCLAASKGESKNSKKEGEGRRLKGQKRENTTSCAREIDWENEERTHESEKFKKGRNSKGSTMVEKNKRLKKKK